MPSRSATSLAKISRPNKTSPILPSSLMTICRLTALPTKMRSHITRVAITPGQQARAELQRASKNDSAAQGYRAKILNQKSSIDSLQAHIENVKASIRVPMDSSAYYAGQANERTQAKMQEIQDLQQKLQVENQKLQDLQEAARKAGFGSAVYEP